MIPAARIPSSCVTPKTQVGYGSALMFSMWTSSQNTSTNPHGRSCSTS